MTRGRPRKPRLSRMDAAVDAMVPLGFPVEKVKKYVKELLEVYGGDSGWPFIEEYAYKELIEAMLRDEEDAEDGNESKETHLEHESAAGTSTRVSESQQDEGPENNSPADIAGSSGAISEPTIPEFLSTSSRINYGDDLPSKNLIPALLPTNCTTPPLKPTNSRASRRRQPCYGWIESDEEDTEDFVFLKPGFLVVREKEVSKIPNDGTKTRARGRSRWDLRPDDP